jgi:hypothetical protein
VLWVCLGCSTRYAPGLKACPHCGSTECVADYDQEAGVPKITVSGGDSHPEDLAAVSALSGVVPVAAVPAPALVPEPAPEAVAEVASEHEATPEPAPAEAVPEPAPAAAPKASAKAAPSLSGPAKKADESG